jgi:glycine cleavage system H lipoate-binding protein
MSTFFFYNNLKNVELIKKINNHFTIEDGYITLESCDPSLKGENENENTLKGKIVHFNTTLQDVLEKINDIPECKSEKKDKYRVEKVWVTRNGSRSEAYIIY